MKIHIAGSCCAYMYDFLAHTSFNMGQIIEMNPKQNRFSQVCSSTVWICSSVSRLTNDFCSPLLQWCMLCPTARLCKFWLLHQYSWWWLLLYVDGSLAATASDACKSSWSTDFLNSHSNAFRSHCSPHVNFLRSSSSFTLCKRVSTWETWIICLLLQSSFGLTWCHSTWQQKFCAVSIFHCNVHVRLYYASMSLMKDKIIIRKQTQHACTLTKYMGAPGSWPMNDITTALQKIRTKLGLVFIPALTQLGFLLIPDTAEKPDTGSIHLYLHYNTTMKGKTITLPWKK